MSRDLLVRAASELEVSKYREVIRRDDAGRGRHRSALDDVTRERGGREDVVQPQMRIPGREGVARQFRSGVPKHIDIAGLEDAVDRLPPNAASREPGDRAQTR